MFVLSEDEKWYRIGLRLSGDKLPIEEIETRLDLEASSVGRKGRHIRDNPRYAKYRTNIWCSSYLTDSDVPFEEQMTELLELLEPKADELKAILAFPDVVGEISLGFVLVTVKAAQLFHRSCWRVLQNLNCHLS